MGDGAELRYRRIRSLAGRPTHILLLGILALATSCPLVRLRPRSVWVEIPHLPPTGRRIRGSLRDTRSSVTSAPWCSCPRVRSGVVWRHTGEVSPLICQQAKCWLTGFWLRRPCVRPPSRADLTGYFSATGERRARSLETRPPPPKFLAKKVKAVTSTIMLTKTLSP